MNVAKAQKEALFLPGVEENPESSKYLELTEIARSSGAEYWEIWHLLAF